MGVVQTILPPCSNLLLRRLLLLLFLFLCLAPHRHGPTILVSARLQGVMDRTNINSDEVGSEGIFKSPNFPEPYKVNTNHLYRLQADHKRITVHFMTFDVGTVSKKRCVDDFVRVVYADDRARKLCGQTNFTLSAYKMLTLELIASPVRLAGKQYRGFEAKYTFSQIKRCGSKTIAQRNGMSGTFMSPSYPMPGYPPDIECHYHIVASRGYTVVLFFRDFDVYGDDNCYLDYVDIFAINPRLSSNSFMARFCGTFRNRRVASNTTHIYLRFFAVTNKQYRGFLVDYRFIPDKVETPVKIENDTAGKGLTIESVPKKNETSLTEINPVPLNNKTSACGRGHHFGFSGQLNFQAPYVAHFNECSWRIEVPAGWQVLLVFVNFLIGQDGLCDENYLLLYDGPPQENVKPIAKLCGQKERSGKEFVSTGDAMYIKLIFRNDAILPRATFHINWSAFITDAGAGSCRGFRCSGGKACIDRSGLSCRQLPQRCLHDSVKCDGIRNCGTEDDSDESGCISDMVRYSVLGATCFLFVLFLVSTVIILKGRAAEHNCGCSSAASSPSGGNSTVGTSGSCSKRAGSGTGSDSGGRANGSLNRNFMEMTNLGGGGGVKLTNASGIPPTSRHRYSYEVIVNQEALRNVEEVM